MMPLPDLTISLKALPVVCLEIRLFGVTVPSACNEQVALASFAPFVLTIIAAGVNGLKNPANRAVSWRMTCHIIVYRRTIPQGFVLYIYHVNSNLIV